MFSLEITKNPRRERTVLIHSAEIRERYRVSAFLSNFVFTEDVAEEVFETNWDLEVNKFDDMGLKESVLRGIYGYGFKDPSPIQQKGILPIIQGKDTIA